MKDRVMGSTFRFPPLDCELKVVEEGAVKECYGCVFNHPKVCQNDPDRGITGECAAERRIDGKGVIFVKL